MNHSLKTLTGPDVTPCEAGRHLLAIAEEHDFTLFEYFQTDWMAHKGTSEDIRHILFQLNELLDVLLAWPEKQSHLLILTSDHGNVEDSSTRRHTKNPVPLIALGEGARELKGNMSSLLDFVPALLKLYPWKNRRLESGNL